METENNYQQMLTDLVSNGTLPTLEQTKQICEDATKLLTAQPNVVEINAPVNIFGNIAGQFTDLVRSVNEIAKDSDKTHLLFTGNYVDRGKQSIASITYLFLRFLLEPERVTLVRGNHECREITKVYGFKAEIMDKYGLEGGETVWETWHAAFDHMPLAAVVSGKVFVSHGGISKHLTTIEEVSSLYSYPFLVKQS